MPEVNEQHRQFVEAYVSNGGNGAAAARAAGYSEKSARFQANALLSRPDVQEAIRAENFRRVERLAPMAVDVLADIMQDKTAAPRDRINAATALLERSSLRRSTRAEVAVTHTMDVAALIAEVSAAGAAGQLNAPRTIDGEAIRLDD